MKSNKLNLIALILAMSTMWGCTTTKPVVNKPLTEQKNVTLVKLCDDHNVYWQWDNITQVITLSKSDQEAKAMIGSNQVVVNGQTFYLSKPVTMAHSTVYVPSDFKDRVIKRLRGPKKIVRKTPKKQRFGRQKIRSIKTIIVDAGHGGKDPGAVGGRGTYEKEVVLDIARKLRAALRKDGYKVIMTRNNDTFISLQQRTEIASSKNADLFVSIHANASRSKSARGIEVFASRNLTYTDKNEEQRLKNHNLFYKNLSIKKSDKNVRTIISDFLYLNKQSESNLLAQSIESSMRKYTKAKSRGVKQSRFFVLRNNLMPAVLVEVGFLSNFKEEKLLRDSSYRKKVAQSIADGIKVYAKAN